MAKEVVILFVILFIVNAEVTENYHFFNPWTPVSSPFGDRLKPMKKEPKSDDEKMYFLNSALFKPYVPVSYIQGLHTFPYYAFGEAPPYYQPPVYPVPDSVNYFFKKDNKERIDNQNYV